MNDKLLTNDRSVILGEIMEEKNKRQLILDAAMNLFVEQGFENTSVQDIAFYAKVAKGTVYIYFKSKEELIHELYNYCYQLDVEACRAGMDEEKDAISKLSRRLDNIINYALKHPKEAMIEQLYLSSPVYRSNPIGFQAEMADDIEAVVKMGIEKGELRPLPVKMLTRIYYNLAQAMYMYILEEPKKWEIYSFRKQCYAMIKDSLSATN